MLWKANYDNNNSNNNNNNNNNNNKTIQASRPHIVLKNHNDKTCFLIDMSVPNNTNMSLDIFEKPSTYNKGQ